MKWNAIRLNLTVLESVKRKRENIKIVISAPKSSHPFAELTVFNTTTNASVCVKVHVKNTVTVVVLKRNLVPDALEYFPQFAVKKELPMTTSVTWTVLKINS